MKLSAEQKRLLAARLPGSLPGWIGLGLVLTLAITLTGGLLGSLLFPLVGSFLGMNLAVWEMARYGFFDGAFLALIWAPGASIVAGFMGAHWKRTFLKEDRQTA